MIKNCGSATELTAIFTSLAGVHRVRVQSRPIGSDHGGPVRLYVAPMYGYKSAKWLSGIEVTRKVIPGYWEERGYDIDAWVGDSNGRNDEQT